MTDDHDVVVVGSGFGGSVTALRLAEKGYRVLVVEAGRRFADDEFARTSWDLRRWLWAPRLGCYGIQRIHRLPDVTILAGAGVGGGSLVYANTLYPPDDSFYDDPQWRDVADWRAELAPAFELAEPDAGRDAEPEHHAVRRGDEGRRRRDGRRAHVRAHPGRRVLRRPARPRRCPTRTSAAPGRRRTGCIQCGECMTGCRHGAKNTLVKNYLYLAERLGVAGAPDDHRDRAAAAPDGGWAVETVRTGAWRGRAHPAYGHGVPGGARGRRLRHPAAAAPDARHRPAAAPVAAARRADPHQLRVAARCAGPRRRDVDFTRGVAITSSFRPAPDTHVEPVRYGHGSNAMGLLSVSLTDGDGPRPRWLTWLADQLRAPAWLRPQHAAAPAGRSARSSRW